MAAKTGLLTLMLLLLCTTAQAQQQADVALNPYQRRQQIDSTYIEPHYRGITLRPRIRTLTQNLQIFNSSFHHPSLIYEPNVFTTIGLQASYNGLGLGLSTKMTRSIQEPELRGVSRYLDVNLDFNSRCWYGELLLTNFQSLYLPSPGRFSDPVVDTLPPTVRADLQTLVVGGEYTRILNHRRFSMRAITNQTEIQRKSTGSLLIRGHVSVNAVLADSSLIPGPLQQRYPLLSQSTQVYALNVNIGPGYAYTLVLGKNFAFTPLFILGAGYQRVTAANGNVLGRSGTAYLSTNWRVTLNYTRPRWFAGFTISGRSSEMRLNEGRLQMASQLGELYFGYRLAGARLLKKWQWGRRIGPVRRWLDA